MARSWFTCKSVVVISAFVTLSIEVLGAQGSYYSYSVESYNDLEEHRPDLLLYRHKRQDEPPNKQQEKQALDNRTNQQLTTPTPVATTTKKPTKTDVINNKSPLPEPNNSTVKKVLGKNLGEDGHGQQKNNTVLHLMPSTKGEEDLLVAPTNQTSSEEDEISIFSEEEDYATFNKSLEQHNITETKNDTHYYYNSTFIVDPAAGQHYWIDMNSNRSDVKINGVLSKSHRRAATVRLSFDFPFYGHIIRNITIATGGFLYTGEYVHSWLAATQYIAPLMANFDTGLSKDSYIKYVDNGTAFSVQWERVSLQDNPKDGEFTFQATLVNNGDIIFVYKDVPLVIENIRDDHHPVKVGLSDAYIIDQNIFFVRRKTIYEYHRVNFNKEDIKNWTVIYLKALPTCLNNRDCTSCLSNDIPNFECTWCPAINRCSNGLDRHRQDWLTKGCDRKLLTNESQCSLVVNVTHTEPHDGHEYHYGTNHPFNTPSYENDDMNTLHNNTFNEHLPGKNAMSGSAKRAGALEDTVQASRVSINSRGPHEENDVKMGASGIITILFIVCVIAGLGVWVLYAYRNPHTTSGQILIRYRPSQWRWKRGEARYTAATIHM